MPDQLNSDRGRAWTEADMQRPWGAEVEFLRHLAGDPALNIEQAAMLRHCAKRIESTALVSASPLDGKYGDVLRPFVSMMNAELHANAGKGDRPGWLSMSTDTCLLEIYYHLAKLQKSVRDDAGNAIVEHSADVANMAMMLVDICGGLATAPEVVTQPAAAVVPDGYVLVPVILPPLAVSKIKDHLAEEHQLHSAKARPLWARLLEIVNGISVSDQEDLFVAENQRAPAPIFRAPPVADADLMLHPSTLKWLDEEIETAHGIGSDTDSDDQRHIIHLERLRKFAKRMTGASDHG